MTDLWYNNPFILLNNLVDFFPRNDLTREEKINAFARLAIYYSVLITVFNLDTKWYAVSVVLLIISFSLGYYENFEDERKTSINCTNPTKENPFMNFTLNDYMKNNTDKPAACPYDKVKNTMRDEFRKDIVPDPADLWGQNISDRQFFTMPWTTVINNQTNFAKWLYGNSGECKNMGLNCDKNRDNRYHQSRYYMSY
jgi:hypothetical protein